MKCDLSKGIAGRGENAPGPNLFARKAFRLRHALEHFLLPLCKPLFTIEADCVTFQIAE